MFLGIINSIWNSKRRRNGDVNDDDGNGNRNFNECENNEKSVYMQNQQEQQKQKISNNDKKSVQIAEIISTTNNKNDIDNNQKINCCYEIKKCEKLKNTKNTRNVLNSLSLSNNSFNNNNNYHSKKLKFCENNDKFKITTSIPTTGILRATTINTNNKYKPCIKDDDCVDYNNHNNYIINNSNNYTNNNNKGSLCIVYLLIGSLFLCLLTITILLYSHINNVTDIHVFRENLKHELNSNYVENILNKILENKKHENLINNNKNKNENDNFNKINQKYQTDTASYFQYKRYVV